jgi:hypothetical protein
MLADSRRALRGKWEGGSVVVYVTERPLRACWNIPFSFFFFFLTDPRPDRRSLVRDEQTSHPLTNKTRTTP